MCFVVFVCNVFWVEFQHLLLMLLLLLSERKLLLLLGEREEIGGIVT
jgi:hypothetical protein